ncbi:MAG: hypothetical protein HQL58_01280 [Magnetococcales bacterium]|nr:hypothetical protein [Magnetococcales bacterium]
MALTPTLTILAPTGLDLDSESDIGFSDSDNITSMTGLVIHGLGMADNSITLFDDKNKNNKIEEDEVLTSDPVVDEEGHWQGEISLDVDGVHQIKAVQIQDTDGDGEGDATSAVSAVLALSVDFVSPTTKPTKLDLATDDDNGPDHSDNITSYTKGLTISGTGDNGLVVVLFDDDTGEPLVAVSDEEGNPIRWATALVTSNKWAVDVNLAAGAHTLSAQQMDLAGNTSENSDSIIIETGADYPLPEAPAGLALLAADDTGMADDDAITNKTALTINGTGVEDAGAKVVVFDGGVSKGTATVTAGSWSLKVSGLAAGEHHFTAKQVVDGETSDESEPLHVVIKTAPPVAPAGIHLDAENDLGPSNSDNITSVTADLTIMGHGELGSRVTLFADKNNNNKVDTGEMLAEHLEVMAGEEGEGASWTAVVESMAAGSYAIKAIQTDLAGNNSPVSVAMPLIIDTTAPLAPGKLDLSAADDSGTNKSDNITGKTSGLTITGTGEKGLRVILFTGDSPEDEGNVLAATTVDAKGLWSADVEFEEFSEYTIQAVQMDLAGNESPAAELTLTIEDIPLPPAPTELALLASDDTGVAGDNITSKSKALTVTGMASAGGKITLSESGKAIGTATADTGGKWSVKIASLTAGAHSLTAQQLADGESSSDSEPLVISVDTSVPAAPAALKIGENGAASQTLASGANLLIGGTGTHGATVIVFDDINKNGKPDAGEPSANTAVDGQTWSADLSLSGGTHAVKAIQTNLAGTASKPSAAINVLVTTPGGFKLAAEDDTGSSKSDAITSKTSGLTLTGTAPGGLKVMFYLGDSDESVATTTVSKGTWKIDLPTLEAGEHIITATQINTAAGEPSERSTPFTLFIDNEAPETPAGLTFDDPAGNGIINKTSGLIITGTGDVGANITLLAAGKSLGTGRVDEDGNWSVTVAKIGSGTHTITASQADLAGNTSPASEEPLVIVVDAVAPAAPSGLKFNSTDGTMTGKGEKGATLTLFQDANKNGKVEESETILGGGEVDPETGNWSVEVSFETGTHANIKAIQSDLAGNVSKASAALTVTMKTAHLTRMLQGYSSQLAASETITIGGGVAMTNDSTKSQDSLLTFS